MKPNKVSEAAPNRPRNSSASRKLVVRGISLSPTEDIARTPNRVNHLGQLAFFELPTQPADVNVYNVRLRVVMIAPDLLEQHRPRAHPASVPHQVFEQPIFARQEIDRPSGAPDLSGKQIDLQVTDAQCRLALRHRVTPDQDLEPGSQFDEFERLCQVIIAAGPEPAYALVHPR